MPDQTENSEQKARTEVLQLKSWEEFAERVHGFDDPSRSAWNEIWYRGQGDADWPLSTTLERRSTIRSVREYLHMIIGIQPEIETFTEREFHIPALGEVDEQCGDYDRFPQFLRQSGTYLAHLRHGGFPSPMLDWSGSPFVAAYFAFSRARHNGNVAVFAYQARPNRSRSHGSDVPNIISFGPLIKTHRRHFRQQSRYTVCARFSLEEGWRFVPHEEVFGQKDEREQDLLWKMTIPAGERQKALRYFDQFNLNEYTLFDTEEGLLEMLANRVMDLRGR